MKKINDLLILIWWPVSEYRICYLQPNFISMRLKCWWIETIAFHGYFAIQRLGITSTSWSEQIGFSSLLVRVGLINLLIQRGLSIFLPGKKIGNRRNYCHHDWAILVIPRESKVHFFIRKELKVSWLHDICRNYPSCRKVSGGCKYRATMKFLLLSYEKWTLIKNVLIANLLFWKTSWI